jgi:hypothetical protein
MNRQFKLGIIRGLVLVLLWIIVCLAPAIAQSIRYIPVVYHNLYNPATGQQGFCDPQTAVTNLGVLNQAYDGTVRPYDGSSRPSGGVNTYVQFFLAAIVSDQTTLDSIDRQHSYELDTLSNLPSMAEYPPSHYLNIFVYPLVGYQANGWCDPTGPLDAALVAPVAFGAHRTSGHEVGHWFGLEHYTNENDMYLLYRMMYGPPPQDKICLFVQSDKDIVDYALSHNRSSNVHTEPDILVVPYIYTLSSALAAATSGKTVVVFGQQDISSYLTVPAGVTLRLTPGSSLVYTSSSTRLLVYGNLVVDGTSSSRVTVNGQGYSRSGYAYAPIVIASGGTASVQYADFKNAPFLFTAFNGAGNITIQNCAFTGFSTSSDAKAISVTSVSGNVSITNNTITGSNQGTGIYSYSNTWNLSVEGNSLSYCGTGIRVYSSYASLTDNIVSNNANYGILADNVSATTNYANNSIRSNGYGLFLNSASPILYENTVIQNASNVHITSSSPTFREPGGSGHNVIAHAAFPLVYAENSSVPYFGHYNNFDGNNSFYDTDLPHMRALSNSCIWAEGDYWGGDPPSCSIDGTSLFYSRDVLISDPNPDPLAKPSLKSTGKLSQQPTSSNGNDEGSVKEMISTAFSVGIQGDVGKAKDSLVWIVENRGSSSYAPLALLMYGGFSGLNGDMVDSNRSASVDKEFRDLLSSLAAMPASNPLRPYAIRLLVRTAGLWQDIQTAKAYSQQLIDEYPGTVHELVSLYDLLVTAVEVDQDYGHAQKYLDTMKKNFPNSDLTTSAMLLCGEKAAPGSSKEELSTQPVANDNVLNAAYPNPFNPSTSIGFVLKADSHVRLAVYDILGREVAKLADGVRGAGQHSVMWNAQTMTSGVYFARIEVADLYGKMLFTKTAKLLLTK